MSEHKSLLVIWKNKSTSLYYHIGTLSFYEEKYHFSYTYNSQSSRSVHEAMKSGYKLHPAFPKIEYSYESETLFESFNQRVPSSSRVGYEEFLSEYGLPLDADRMDVLQATRGVIANDPYSFEQPLRLYGEELISSFYINGMRHFSEIINQWTNLVKEGDKLSLVIDKNENDPFAIKVLAKGVEIGFIPGIYSQAIHSLLARDTKIEMTVKKVRPDYSPQWWVEVSFFAEITMEDIINIEKTATFHVIDRIVA